MNGMSRQVDGPRSRADEVSAQEYQDDEFNDELGLSAPPHPLFPASPDSNNAATHKKNCGQPELADKRTPSEGLVSTEYSL